MLALELFCRPEQREALIAELWELGTTGVLEHERGLTAYFADADAGALKQAFRGFAPRITQAPECDWTAVARSQWTPLEVGRRWFLAPEWCADPTPAGRVRLVMRPAQACGTGLHPATQVCLEFMEEVVRPGAVVLDVGTGSGLLAAAAAALGAGRIVACDIEEQAVREARARFQEEHATVLLFQGSLRAIRSRVAEVATVNIHAAAAVQLAPELARVLAPGGAVILSGFRGRDLEAVREAARAAGLRPERLQRRQGWVGLVCYTPSYAPT